MNLYFLYGLILFLLNRRMNTLRGTISSIETEGNISLVKVQVGDSKLTSVIIETPQSATYLFEGNELNVLFKETEVVIGKGEEISISLQNRLECIVQNIEVGALLGKLTLQHPKGIIRSVITANAIRQLNIKVGDEVMALIKTNEVMLSA